MNKLRKVSKEKEMGNEEGGGGGGGGKYFRI